ncbi:hypothetical protein BJV78DRAFT_1074105, partial [Lactifluus subvellereus]
AGLGLISSLFWTVTGVTGQKWSRSIHSLLFFCKMHADDVHRYHNSKDRVSAADFKHHAPRCFGEEAVN